MSAWLRSQCTSSSVRSTKGLTRGGVLFILGLENPAGHGSPAGQELAIEAPAVGLELLHQAPEGRRMVHVLGMRKLVNEQVAAHLWTVKHQKTSPAATAP